MNLSKTERLIALLRANGVTHFKTNEIEIHLTSTESFVQPSIGTAAKKSIPASAVPPVESTIPHHVNEVANLLKLSDSDLVDKLFPDYSHSELPPKD